MKNQRNEGNIFTINMAQFLLVFTGKYSGSYFVESAVWISHFVSQKILPEINRVLQRVSMVTSRPLVFLQKEAVLSPCNFATAHLTACILNMVSPCDFATHEMEDPYATPHSSVPPPCFCHPLWRPLKHVVVYKIWSVDKRADGSIFAQV